MPPKIKTSRIDIIETAFSLLREKGKAFVTVRQVAQKLGTTQIPIYRCFKDSEELMQVLLKKSSELLTQYQDEKITNDPLLNMGVGYVKFAKENPHLFWWMFGCDDINHGLLRKMFKKVIAKCIKIAKDHEMLKSYEEGEIKEMFVNIWIYTHGLASLIASETIIYKNDLDILREISRFAKRLMKQVS